MTDSSIASTHPPVSTLSPLPRWILVWFLVTIPIMLWDGLFILCRPASLPGGALDWIWGAYRPYLAVDLRYANPQNTLVVAFAWANLLEMLLSIVVCIRHVQHRSDAWLWAFTVALITLTKTFLYFGSEWTSGRANTGHAQLLSFLGLYVLLNGVWLFVPSLIVWKTGQQMALRLKDHA